MTLAFEPDHFTATQWSTAGDNARVANALTRLMADELHDATRNRKLATLARLKAKGGARETPSPSQQTLPPHADLFS
jgi:hypothetical protein